MVDEKKPSAPNNFENLYPSSVTLEQVEKLFAQIASFLKELAGEDTTKKLNDYQFRLQTLKNNLTASIEERDRGVESSMSDQPITDTIRSKLEEIQEFFVEVKKSLEGEAYKGNDELTDRQRDVHGTAKPDEPADSEKKEKKQPKLFFAVFADKHGRPEVEPSSPKSDHLNSKLRKKIEGKLAESATLVTINLSEIPRLVLTNGDIVPDEKRENFISSHLLESVTLKRADQSQTADIRQAIQRDEYLDEAGATTISVSLLEDSAALVMPKKLSDFGYDSAPQTLKLYKDKLYKEGRRPTVSYPDINYAPLSLVIPMQEGDQLEIALSRLGQASVDRGLTGRRENYSFEFKNNQLVPAKRKS